jgi:type IV pilus assembly protein PilC
VQVFTYKAKNRSGEVEDGLVEAETAEAAAAIITSRDLFPIDVTSESKRDLSFFDRVSSRDRTFLARQLSTMITAGLPISESLNTLKEQTHKKALLTILQEVASDVEGGGTLSSSFAKHPKLFSSLDLTIIASGEKSGTLDLALNRIADRLEKDLALMRKVRSALIYPAAVLLVTVAVLVLMIMYVMPQMEVLYKSFDAQLPFATRIMIGLSHVLGRFFPVFIAMAIALAIATRYYIKSSQGRRQWDTIKLKSPGFGKLLQMLYTSRFSRTLSTLVASGVPILDALEITSRAVGNVLFKGAITDTAEKVKNGVPLSTGIQESLLFPPIVYQMITVGEKTGEMDNMLNKLANYFEEEVDAAVRNISELIMPALIVILGLLVGAIVLSSILPIYNIGNITGG